MERKLLTLFVVAIFISLGVVNIVGFTWLGSRWLWEQLVAYVDPTTPTERKDVVNVFVLIAAAIVGSLTALAALGNLYLSRINLQQARETLRRQLNHQRDLEERRAQHDALQSYFEQMGDLLTKHNLLQSLGIGDLHLPARAPLTMIARLNEIHTNLLDRTGRGDLRLLARAQTLTVIARLDASLKGDVIRFLGGAGLINAGASIIDLSGADLSEADLGEADLGLIGFVAAIISAFELLMGSRSGAVDLSRTNLRGANLSGANLSRVNLSEANLSGANLTEANLSEANLKDAKGVTNEQLDSCESLDGATMPDGQTYEDWRILP